MMGGKDYWAPFQKRLKVRRLVPGTTPIFRQGGAEGRSEFSFAVFRSSV
jgi:hypothetical protein